jgi:DNA-binding response OmpR family regulator
LIGPDEEKRSAVAKALAETRRANVREFDSYPPELDHLQRLQTSFDVIILDLDSDPDVALELAERASASDAATIMVYSEKADPKLAVRFMRAGAREYLLLPLEQGAVAEALVRTEAILHEKALPAEKTLGRLLVRPERWRIPDDQGAARALQYGDTGLAETRISGASLEMASSNTGRPIPQERKRDLDLRGLGRSIAQVDSGNDDRPSIAIVASADARTTPTITWPTPDPISYGDRLTSAQLNATASVAGTFVYTPGPGFVLPPGKHTIWVTFTPADSDGYAPLLAAISIVVAKATPPLSWPPPAEITYGTALDDTQLNASAPVPGRFDYSPAAGEVLPPGTHTLSVTFTPADSANYAATQATVSLTVARATSTIQWPTPDPITYGTQLSTTQLCAAASVPGLFEYNPGLGAVLAAGEHKLSVIFTPADAWDYSPSQTAVLLTVAKATPGITWPTPDPIAYGAALSATQLNATATVPGSLAYTPSAGEVLTPGVHELSVTFTPTDTLNYTTVRAVGSLTVTEKLPTLITWPAPSAICYGTALSATQLNATASVPGTFVYTPSAGHVLAPGRYTLSASFTPSDTDKYAPAQAAVVLEVEGSPDIASLPNAATETPSTRTFTASYSAPADSVPLEVTRERTATKTYPRETRTYKGALYEKGADGRWHLQKK